MLDCQIRITAIVNTVSKFEDRTICNAAESMPKQKNKKKFKGRNLGALSNLENAEQPAITDTWKGQGERIGQS